MTSSDLKMQINGNKNTKTVTKLGSALIPGAFTSIAGDAVNNDIEETFSDNVHVVRVFRCVRRPQEQYKRIISLCEDENEGTIRLRLKGPDSTPKSLSPSSLRSFLLIRER